MNNRNDFEPNVRNQALWASDTRRIIDGKAAEVYLERTGNALPVDLSEVEAVQWGLRLQDSIGRAVSDKMQVGLKDADYMMTHPQHSWMRSHFDFITDDGSTLIEVKNYGTHQRKYYGDDGTHIIKAADRGQLVHEAAVHGVKHIVLAVLFGGQELCLYPHQIADQEKDELVEMLSVHWGQIVSRTPPAPESIEAAKKLYPVSVAQSVTAGQQLEQQVAALKQIKAQIKALETQESGLQAWIQGQLTEADTLIDIEGRVLATWKSSKPSMSFDATLFKQAMPDVFDRFVVEKAGSRRFLIK